MNIIHYSIRSFFTNEYYSIIRFTSKRLFVATLLSGLALRHAYVKQGKAWKRLRVLVDQFQ